jgi:large subunit ribosomal protein L21
MEIAVIKTGGKQYIVSPKQKIKIEKVAGEEGDKVEFKEVLLFSNDKIIEIGKPLIKGAKVVAKILKQGRGDKIIIFKYKAKKRYQKKAGHRQFFTEVEISEIIAA